MGTRALSWDGGRLVWGVKGERKQQGIDLCVVGVGGTSEGSLSRYFNNGVKNGRAQLVDERRRRPGTSSSVAVLHRTRYTKGCFFQSPSFPTNFPIPRTYLSPNHLLC